MSQQPSIAAFFGKRKRIGSEDIKANAKRLLLDDDYKLRLGKYDTKAKDVEFDKIQTHNEGEASNRIERAAKITLMNGKPTTSRKNAGKSKTAVDGKVQLDIRESVKKQEDKKVEGSSSPVKFLLMGNLSPAKKAKPTINTEQPAVTSKTKDVEFKTPVKLAARNDSSGRVGKLNLGEDVLTQETSSTDDIIKTANELVNKIKETRNKLCGNQQQKSCKDLSLSEIRERIKKSSKLTELKKSINKINQHAADLLELEQKNKGVVKPQISKFDSFEVEIPTSPHKDALCSPLKSSPLKQAAFERYHHLATASHTLSLPFSYQTLYSMFQAVDTVCSMMMGRENITFKKLKSAVEKMTSKNFTEHHLGQMTTILPEAFTFQQEKLRNFGSTSKADRYELVVTPVIPVEGTVDTRKKTLTPALLKARKAAFYNVLLERTKDEHEKFLLSLETPIRIPRNELQRWHVNFPLDSVPEIGAQALPQPPDTQKPATAKDVLERARDFLQSNTRLQRALEAASSETTPLAPPPTSEPPPDVKKKVDAKLGDPFKGISTSLLAKIRAKQAAKALDAMRMTPQEETNTLRYTRLPELCRIVRTLFVNEGKGVLCWERVLDRLRFSYNRQISVDEAETHLNLLIQHLPEWLSVLTIRNAKYLKASRTANLTDVIGKLDKLVEQKKQSLVCGAT